MRDKYPAQRQLAPVPPRLITLDSGTVLRIRLSPNSKVTIQVNRKVSSPCGFRYESAKFTIQTNIASIISNTFSPVFIDEHLSLPEFFTRYNPDDVEPDKLVHTDTISGKSVTYGGLRTQAASGAWGLKNLGVKEGDVVMVVLTSCVSTQLRCLLRMRKAEEMTTC
jgi:hypothetical protein